MTTRSRYEVLPSGVRRRLVAMALLRSAVSVALLVVVYYLAPLDEALDFWSWMMFGAGLLAFAGAIAWQVHRILGSDMPRLRAIQAVAVGLPFLLLLFASTYVVIADNQPGGFTEPLSRTAALYFTVTVFATVGFGDIAPKTDVARLVTMVQMLTGLVAVGLIAKIVLGAVQVAVRLREVDPSAPVPGADGQQASRLDGAEPDTVGEERARAARPR
jgi:voltage-gated potassium channel